MMSLHLLAALGTPPKLAGALWTWPAAMRSMSRFVGAMNELTSALLEIALVGNDTVLDLAIAVAESLSDAASNFPARRGGGSSEAFADSMSLAADRIMEVIAAARADLRSMDR
jgi:hypothetical protein